MLKKIIVVMSTYNGAKNIEKQLNSIFAQQGVYVSLYIRDDCSTDNTIEVINNYKKQHPQYEIIIEQGKNLGFAKSFWTALLNCGEADYYAFSDQDDIWKKDKLLKCIDIMDEQKDMAQLSYCNMQRSDENLNRLPEQVSLLYPKELTKKLTLIKTFNYGAATVINKQAKILACRTWPEVEDLPHDMWIGMICYWFGKVYFVNEELYYWIRYNTSVTGEGTKKAGIFYRLKKTMNRKSYPNVSIALLQYYDDLLLPEDKKFLVTIKNYKKNFRDKIKLLFDFSFKRTNLMGTISLKLGILLNWY